MTLYLYLILFMGVQWSRVVAFTSGPPADACATLTPDPTFHGPPQTSSVDILYEVDLSPLRDPNGGLSYLPGETYQCTYVCCWL